MYSKLYSNACMLEYICIFWLIVIVHANGAGKKFAWKIEQRQPANQNKLCTKEGASKLWNGATSFSAERVWQIHK